MTDDKSKSSFDELAAAIPTTLTGAPSAPPPKRSASNAPPPITPVKARGSWTPTRDAAGNRAPGWDKWGKMPVIRLWEGVALSLNLDPGKVRQEYSWMAEARFFDESQEFKDRLEVAERSVGRHPLLRRECNSLVDPCDYLVSIDSFIAWAKSIGWDLPDGGLRSQPPKQNAPIEITLPAGGGGYMRLGDALETVPMLIAFALFPRGGEMVRGAKRIENGVEIIKQSQGPDDTEIKKLIESGEWTPITMDMEIYQRTMRNEVAQEWREKLESAAKAGRLAIIDSLSRLPATGMNPENLIPIHALNDWCASIGVTIKAESKSAAEQQVNGNHRELEQPKVVINRLKLNDQRLSILRQILDEQFPDYANEKLDIAPIEMWMLCRNKEPNLFQPQTPDAQGEYQTVKQFFGFARRNGVPIYFKKGR